MSTITTNPVPESTVKTCTVRLLPQHQWIPAAARATAINPANAPATHVLRHASPDTVLPPAHLALLTQRYWGPAGVRLTVGFLDNPPADLRARILSHMNAWGNWANVEFVETASDAQVRIDRAPGEGYWSYLGTDILSINPNQKTMNLDSFSMNTPESEFYRVVRHETGHTLGFPHEHMRSEIVDRIDPEKAIAYFMQTQGWSRDQVIAQVLTPLDSSALTATQNADPDSIMCYWLPAEIMKDGVAVPGGKDVDAMDAQFAASVYPKQAGAAVTVYEDANFQGRSAALGVGRYDWGQLGIANDTLSSLKVPPGLAATLYEDTHFGGRSKIFTHDASYVADDFNDITSSIVVANTSTESKALNFLRNISGLRTVAGQHNREPNSDPAKWTNAIHDTCGKFPGLWSGDFLYEQDNINKRGTMINEAMNQWSHGALINLMYHAAPPNQGEPCAWEGGVLSRLSDDEWNRLINDGSDLNSKWKARLDVISVFLQDLKDHGVEVLWRPFHEMNQGNFWWGGRPGPQGTARLYQITHDYMVGTKGLTNLIWVWDVQDLDFNWAPYNPGDGYWDILAMDMYGDGYTTQKYDTILQLAGDKPIAIGECKILPTAQELAAQPRWTFFMAWAELVFSDNGIVTNSVQQINDLYNATTVITRGQMPGWG